jgi:hypothetical protein
MRLTVDATVRGSYGDRITYAALSADGRGVASYGAISMTLSDITVSDRATVLKNNSWRFVQSRNLFGKVLPPGLDLVAATFKYSREACFAFPFCCFWRLSVELDFT